MTVWKVFYSAETSELIHSDALEFWTDFVIFRTPHGRRMIPIHRIWEIQPLDGPEQDKAKDS